MDSVLPKPWKDTTCTCLYGAPVCSNSLVVQGLKLAGGGFCFLDSPGGFWAGVRFEATGFKGLRLQGLLKGLWDLAARVP